MFSLIKKKRWLECIWVGRRRASPLPIRTVGFRNLWPVQPLRKVNLGREKPTAGGRSLQSGCGEK
jgi:hypothetical protein